MFQYLFQRLYRLLPISEPDGPHAEGLGGLDVVVEVVYEDGFSGGEAEMFKDSVVNAGVGFHHTHFGGDEEDVERLADFPSVE